MPIKLARKFQPLAPWFEKHQRAAWKPVVKKGDGGPLASKFAGSPWLARGEAWPACGNCGGPMRLFLQLDLDALPDEVDGRYGSGLLQAFLCIKDDCVHGASEGDPFSRCQLLRVVNPSGKGGAAKEPVFRGDLHRGPFPAKRIVGWKRFDDYPSLTEMEQLGLEHSDDDRLLCKALKFSAPADVDEFCDLSACAAGEKLAGWPGWVNVSTEYPDCPKCGRAMKRVVFQIGYDDNLPFMFGDGAQGHVVQCPRHKGVLAFPWTCD